MAYCSPYNNEAMPELPEVETIRLGLEKYLIGRKIKDIKIRVAKIFVGKKADAIGAKIIDLKRIGKALIIGLDNDFVLIVHLKMTGQLIYQDAKTKGLTLSAKIGGATLPSKYSHIIFTLDNGAFLYYNDLRQFGWLKIVKKTELMQIPFFKEMGPEPFVASPKAGFSLRKIAGQAGLQPSVAAPNFLTLNLLKDILKQSNISIKPLLMEQKKIGGIGNIYANDALFEAGINPQRKSKTLSETEIKKLYNAILKVLRKGLRYGGSSDENFVNALGQEGNYQDHTLVYGREGEKCRVCGSKVQKVKLGGRGTYFCPACQR